MEMRFTVTMELVTSSGDAHTMSSSRELAFGDNPAFVGNELENQAVPQMTKVINHMVESFAHNTGVTQIDYPAPKASHT